MTPATVPATPPFMTGLTALANEAMDRVYTRISQRVPWLARQCFGAMRFAAQRTPHWYGRIAARELGSADGRVIREGGFATFAEMSGDCAPAERSTPFRSPP